MDSNNIQDLVVKECCLRLDDCIVTLPFVKSSLEYLHVKCVYEKHGLVLLDRNCVCCENGLLV
jgi:hypothetical protein